MPGGVGERIFLYQNAQMHCPDKRLTGFIQGVFQLMLCIQTQQVMMCLPVGGGRAVTRPFQAFTLEIQHHGQIVIFLYQLPACRALNVALFQLVAQDTTGCTKGRAPVVSVVSVGLRQRIFFLLCPFNGRDGLIHQAGVLKMGGSGLFQLCQCGLQIFRDSVVRHFPAPRHFRLRKL